MLKRILGYFPHERELNPQFINQANYVAHAYRTTKWIEVLYDAVQLLVYAVEAKRQGKRVVIYNPETRGVEDIYIPGLHRVVCEEKLQNGRQKQGTGLSLVVNNDTNDIQM